ncbi:nuclear receptor corepressor 2 [Tyrophagus putrescentiae]|nr:nuclear receptor corepressor 2 [Tyrophagus putrescentiae]
MKSESEGTRHLKRNWFMMEQGKRFEQMAATASAAVVAAVAGGNSAAEKQAAGDRFRSVEAMMTNHNAAANSPSLKFAREPFSSEHFERELRQMDFSGRVLAEHDELLKGERLSSHSSFGGGGQPMINPMKPSTGSVSLEQMDEASKLFSASFQKDSAHQRNNSSGSGQMTAPNLIDAIITRQINTDLSGSTKGNAPPSSTTATSLVSGTTATTFSAPPQTGGGGSGGGQPSLAPPATNTGLKLLSRPSSTSLGHSSQSSSVIKVDGEAEEKLVKQGPIDFSKVLPPTSASAAAAAAAVAGSSVPAGSLRETIFNVISNNFSGSPSAMDSKKTATTTTSSTTSSSSASAAHQANLDSSSMSTSSSIDKLRKALQTGEGSKHHLVDASSKQRGPPVKRYAHAGDINQQLRQQVIQMAGSYQQPQTTTTTPTSSSSASRPSLGAVSPPSESNASNHSSSSTTAAATVTAATHWPVQQPTTSTSSAPSVSAGMSSSSSSSNPCSPWTSMPTILLFGMGGNLSAAVTSGSGAFANFFQNRIEEAISRAGSPKSGTITAETTRNTRTTEKAANLMRKAYSDSPSSPLEIVIDENRISSPDIIKPGSAPPLPAAQQSSTTSNSGNAPVHRTGPATSDVDMVDETSRPSSSAVHDASAHSSGFAASDDLHKVSPAAHGSSSQPNGHLPQTTRMEVDAPSVSHLVYGSGSSHLKGQDALDAKMEVDVPFIVSPPAHVPTAPTEVLEGAIGPSSHQQQSKRPMESKSDIHFKKPKSAAEVNSSAYRFHRSSHSTKLEVPIRQPQNDDCNV